MKKNISLAVLLLACVGINIQAQANTEVSSTIDQRKGFSLDKVIKENPQDLAYSQQTGGEKPLYNELFKPTLLEWNKKSGSIRYSASNFAAEKDKKIPQPPKKIEEVSDLSRVQYFYKESLHAELIGRKAKEILEYTHSRGGKVFVSTSIVKIYPEKTYEDEDTKQKEVSQCVDILTRITVTRVPLKTTHGLEQLIDYWHDIKNYQCRSNAPTE